MRITHEYTPYKHKAAPKSFIVLYINGGIFKSGTLSLWLQLTGCVHVNEQLSGEEPRLSK